MNQIRIFLNCQIQIWIIFFFFLLLPGPPISLHAGPHFLGQTTHQGCSPILCCSTAWLRPGSVAHASRPSDPPFHSSTGLKRAPSPPTPLLSATLKFSCRERVRHVAAFPLTLYPPLETGAPSSSPEM
jgi:hypothetical protein